MDEAKLKRLIRMVEESDIEELEIPLEKTDVRVAELKLVWIPTG